jgi:phosphate acetyltransferase
VRVGDRLSVQVTVIDKDAETRNVRLDCAVLNQLQQTVVSGEALVRAPTSKVLRPRADLPTLHLFDPDTRLRDWMAGLLTQATQAGQVGQAGQTGPVDPPALPCARRPPLRCPRAARGPGGARPGSDRAAAGGARGAAAGAGGRARPVARRRGDRGRGTQPRRGANVPPRWPCTGDVQALMKGSLHTDELMKAVLSRAELRTKRRLSHVFRFDVPMYHKPLFITDAALNIAPTLDEKVHIVQNAIDLVRVLGVEQPKVAVLAAVESVNSKMVATLDAAALCKMADRGQITGGIIDGPLAFDNAISAEAAQTKGIYSPVAGDPDILVVPDLVSGNILAKQLEYLAGAMGSGVVLGARVPIALTSRADGATARLCSARAGGAAGAQLQGQAAVSARGRSRALTPQRDSAEVAS